MTSVASAPSISEEDSRGQPRHRGTGARRAPASLAPPGATPRQFRRHPHGTARRRRAHRLRGHSLRGGHRFLVLQHPGHPGPNPPVCRTRPVHSAVHGPGHLGVVLPVPAEQLHLRRRRHSHSDRSRPASRGAAQQEAPRRSLLPHVLLHAGRLPDGLGRRHLAAHLRAQPPGPAQLAHRFPFGRTASGARLARFCRYGPGRGDRPFDLARGRLPDGHHPRRAAGDPGRTLRSRASRPGEWVATSRSPVSATL